MHGATRFSAFLLLTLTIRQISGCHDAFVNITALAKPFQEKTVRTVTINGCIERIQTAFDSKFIETLEIQNQRQPELKKDSIKHMAKLKLLRFENCSIEAVHPETFRNLIRITDLIIKGNNIRTIEPFTFTRDMPIVHLDLSNNHLQVIKGEGFSGMTSLKKLRLNFNELQTLNGNWFRDTKLEILDVGYNKIARIPSGAFKFTPKMRHLHFEFNDISVIEPNAFKNVNNLETVILRHNKLTSFHENLFTGSITKIGKLYLSANRINFLSEKLMEKLVVQLITLDGNPMLCNCVDPVRAWLGKNNGTLGTWEGCSSDSLPFCVFPKVLSVGCNEIVDEEATNDYLDKLSVLKDKLNALCVRFD